MRLLPPPFLTLLPSPLPAAPTPRLLLPVLPPPQVLTVVISFVLYPKPLSWKYGLGGVCVLLSLAVTQELQRRKGGDVKHAPPKDEAAEEEPLRDADVEMAQVEGSALGQPSPTEQPKM